MGDTYGKAVYHIVWNTKKRHPWLLTPEQQKRCWAYLSKVAEEYGVPLIAIGGIADHVHLMFDLPPAKSLSEVVKHLKGNSSLWIKTSLPDCGGFSWQDGYGYFVVCESIFEDTRNYVVNQTTRHRDMNYQNEMRVFLKKNNIEYEDKYLWRELD